MRLVRLLMVWVWVGVVSCVAASTLAADLEPLRALPVLDGGRVKPIDTAARESIRLITGRERFQGMDPLALSLTIEREPAAWETQALVHVPFIELRKTLGLAEGVQHVSPAALRGSAEIARLAEGAEAKKRSAEATREDPRLSRLEERAVELRARLAEFDRLAKGERFAMYPGKSAGDAWELTTRSPLGADWKRLLDASGPAGGSIAAEAEAIAAAQLNKATEYGRSAFIEYRTLSSPLVREVAYHRIHPFRYAWVMYLGALLVLSVSLMVRNPWVYRAGMALLLGGIGWSLFAFAWRCSITGWAPVTNIYETVIWVALVGAITAVGIEWFSKGAKIPAIAGAVSATGAGLVADIMPPEYGAAVRTLAPVLQSNFWLSVHVLTIVSSYAAFLVALVLGNIVMGQYAWGRGDRDKETKGQRDKGNAEGGGVVARTVGAGGTMGPIATNLRFLYRAVQVGVLLVAAGTILGGLWADVSWGRFWGWDPKEVWALIILLVYVALLHGRFAGWVGPFGLAAGSVVCFLTVLMSWYGVNFVLGAGQHSYGFGTGGQGTVAAFCAAQLAYTGVCWTLHRRRTQTSAFAMYTPADDVQTPSPAGDPTPKAMSVGQGA